MDAKAPDAPSGVNVPSPIELTDAASIAGMVEASRKKAVLVYKHSISCPVSGYAWYEVRDCLEAGDEAPPCYRVTVQYHPDVSHQIAAMLQVAHHTPQVILLRNGRVDYVASHWQIRKQALQRALLDS